MDSKEIKLLLLRYIVLIILPLSGLFIFYWIFGNLTIYPSYLIIKTWSANAVLLGENTIFYNGHYIEIVSACIAGSAYYLLLILNLTTPMQTKKRIKSISFIIISFLILNIFRIVIFAHLYDSGFNYFDLAHKAVWYFGSTFLVVLIWFANVFIFRIHAIPIYTDVRNIIRSIK